MFELEYPIHNLELSTNRSICVSCSNKKRHQLLELALPTKLVVNNSSEITSNTDLKIRCGTFTHSRIAHMKACKLDQNIYASHIGKQGVFLYNLSTDDSDHLKEKCILYCELEEACFDLNDIELVLTKDTTLPVFVMDLKTSEMIRKVQFSCEVVSCSESVTPMFLSTDVIALCHLSSGQVQIFDKRDTKIHSGVGCEKEPSWNSFWTFSSFCGTEQISHTSCLAKLSDKGTFMLFDLRNFDVPILSKYLGIRTKSDFPIDLKFKSTDKSWISVSGFDGNVYVYKVTSEPELMFVHDGHKHVEGHSSQTTTTAHVWYPDIDNLLISSAENGTVQTWQFEDKKELDS